MARTPRRETPLLTARRLLTVALLGTSLLLVLIAQYKFGRPGTWRWVTGDPTPLEATTLPDDRVPTQQPNLALVSEATRASLLVGHSTGMSPAAACLSLCGSYAAEYVPLPTSASTSATRRAPYPNLRLLAGAVDGEPFLFAQDALPELQASARAAADAAARYHLLQLAHDALPGSLEADARSNVRYEALRQKPDDYRGELVSITGTLVSLGAPMELHGKLSGLDVCYLAYLIGDRPEHRYLVLFTDLPPALVEREKDWGQLFLPNVTFAGYSYKVAKFTQSSGKRREWLMPVLVGKAPCLPELVAEDKWPVILIIFAVMAVPVVLASLVLPRFFRRADTRHRRLMEHIRARHDERLQQGLTPPPEATPAEPKRVSSDHIDRLREGRSPTEWN